MQMCINHYHYKCISTAGCRYIYQPPSLQRHINSCMQIISTTITTNIYQLLDANIYINRHHCKSTSGCKYISPPLLQIYINCRIRIYINCWMQIYINRHHCKYISTAGCKYISTAITLPPSNAPLP